MKSSILLSAVSVSALFFISGFVGATCGVREVNPTDAKCFAFARSTPMQLRHSGLSEQLVRLQLGAIEFDTAEVTELQPLPDSIQSAVLATEDRFQSPFSAPQTEMIEGLAVPAVASSNEM